MEFTQSQRNVDNKKIVRTPRFEPENFIDIGLVRSVSFSAIETDKKKYEALEDSKAAHIRAIKYFDQGDFRSAEQEIVKVIKPVLSKSMMKSRYIDLQDVLPQTLDSMYHLGLVHLHNQDRLYDNNHVKAASIFQYCAQFANKYGISLELDGKKEAANGEYFIDKAFEIEQQFLSDLALVKKQSSLLQQSKDKINSYKAELDKLREYAKEQLSYIEDLTIEDIETRSEAVEQIYEYSTEFFINHETKQGLLQRLIVDCHQQLGDPPKGCDYSVVGLGSLSLGTMTPWSDLEFAVLINKDTPEYKEYFRNLTKLLWIKVINFGETVLRGVGIETLNNFKSAEIKDEWLWDSVITSGFSFDGAHWHACKVPLGRKGYKALEVYKDELGIEHKKIIKKPDYELILTPEEMLQFQLDGENAEDTIPETGREEYKLEPPEEASISENANKSLNWFATDRHLVQALQSVALIEGSQKLLDQYRQDLSEKTDRALQQEKSRQILEKDLDKFRLALGEGEEGKLLDVKQNIYRLGDRIVSALANYYNITAGAGESHITVWQMIDRMKDKAILNEEGAQYLKEAISIATELRMRTYSNNEGRYDNISTYIPAVEHLNEVQRKVLLEKTFYIKDTAMLHHFYHVMIAMQKMTNMFCSEEPQYKRVSIFGRLSDALDEGKSKSNKYNYFKGMICARFLKYDKAFEYLEKASTEKPDDLIILENLRSLCSKIGKIDQELKITKKLISKKLVILDETKDKTIANYLDIANSYNNLGNTYSNKGLYDKALNAFGHAINIRCKIYQSTPHHPDIAASYNSLGTIYANNGLYDQAIIKFNEALEILLKIYKTTPNHPDIATSHNNLGTVYSRKDLYDQAITEFNKSLEIKLKAYESTPNHPEIAMSYNNLGSAYHAKGLYDQAIAEHQKALGIRLKAYADTPDHPDIAMSYNNLGVACYSQGLYDAAIEEYKKALKIYLKVHEPTLNHPNIATVYNNLGNTYHRKDLYDQAIENHIKALVIRKNIHKNTPNHPDIAMSYNNLGILYSKTQEYDKAVGYIEKSMKIYRKVHVSNPSNPDLIRAYKNLAASYFACKEQYNDLGYKYAALHYRNMAAFLASNGDLLKAYDVFNTAYTKFPYSMTAAFYAEYAQFLIANPLIDNAITTDSDYIVTELLMRAMTTIDDSILEYGATEKTIAPHIIQQMIETKDGIAVKIDPKSLALYLAITTQGFTSYLEIFKKYCLEFPDRASFDLFLEAYSFVGNVELAEKYSSQEIALSSVLITHNITEENLESDSETQSSGESDDMDITD